MSYVQYKTLIINILGEYMKDTKQCRTCSLVKSIKEYHKDGKGGYRKDCKPCRREIRSSTNAKNKINDEDTKSCTACGEEKNIIKVEAKEVLDDLDKLNSKQ